MLLRLLLIYDNKIVQIIEDEKKRKPNKVHFYSKLSIKFVRK